MKRSIRELVLAPALLVAGCVAASPTEAQQGDNPLLVGAGRDLFVRHCSACHGMDGIGDGPAASALRTAPADLTTISQRRGGAFQAAEIARMIDGRSEVTAHGSREMPVWGRRFGEGIRSETAADEVARGNISVLVDYLRTIQRPADPRSDPK